MKKANLVTIKINGVEITCTQEQAIAIATACGNNVSTEKKTSKKSAPKSAPAKAEPTPAQVAARKAWGEAQHKRAEARKELFAIVDTPEYKREWEKWQKSKAYKNATTRAERKELNKAKHAEIVAKLSK